MRPFFSFYGAKWRAAPMYPEPLFEYVIEPFAGSAGYSVRYAYKKVVLVEKDPKIAAIWRYLIRSCASDILDLPLIQNDEQIEDLPICQEAKWFIGFWCNSASVQPVKRPGAWMRQNPTAGQFWGETLRTRIAMQINKINHWQIYEGDYSHIGNYKATWFIDPPYNNNAGSLYKHSCKQINFAHLADFCKSREGQVIVCENEGANWLEFKHLMFSKSNSSSKGKGYSSEVIWTNEP